MEIKCPFWPICGPALIHQRLAQRAFPYGDPQRDYIATVCSDEGRCLECEHYKIRIKPKEAEKNETERCLKKVRKRGSG
jgi:hypothetical protein